MTPEISAVLMGGIPAHNMALYHRAGFLVGDPVALIERPREAGGTESILILREIELERAAKIARVDRVAGYAEFAPAGGLSGDRETATAQAAAECLRRANVRRVVADRTLPLLFVHVLAEAGIEVACDAELGVVERRAKRPEELDHLRVAQAATERAIEAACRRIAAATLRADGVLMDDGAPLTSERVREAIDVGLLRAGYDNPPCIVAGGRIGADCHDRGSGALRTGEPVIIDVFPLNRTSRYNGDCTRCVVHGEVPGTVARMHAAVLAAKEAATAATRAGATGDAVHAATTASLVAAGYEVGSLPPAGANDDWIGLTHGTGHGLGLEVHEPPLLDVRGPALVAGDVLTIEPGLYGRAVGGIRIEDMVVVTASGCENLGAGLPTGLDWR